MSLVTQCPQCALLFQVPHDLLAQAQGWVRCGQCHHHFEGEVFAIKAPVLDAPLLSEPVSDSPRVDVEALLRRKDVPVEPEAVEAAAMPLPLASKAAIPLAATASAQTLQPVSVSIPVDSRRSEAPAFQAAPSLWVHRCMAFLLAGGLVVQALIFFKDELAAQMPSLRPGWAALCRALACQPAPLRRWNGIVIDSSALVRSEAGYTLNVTLRNAQPVTLAMTAIELTLTDEQDRAVVRRVLSPLELGAPTELAAGQTWARSWSVEPTPALAEIAGYRLVSFYP